MKYWYDTEFDETSSDGIVSVQAISIGIVAEDGRELYWENADYDWLRPNIDPWMHANVAPHLIGGETAIAPHEIKQKLIAFFAGDTEIELWGYFADYDHAVLCSFFGRMIDLPKGMPKLSMDLKQRQKTIGMPKSMAPADPANEHHALADARWNRELDAAMDAFEASQAG